MFETTTPRKILVLTPSWRRHVAAVPELLQQGRVEVHHSTVPPGALHSAAWAEDVGFDGIVLNSMDNLDHELGLPALRRSVSIPVAGVGEIAHALAALVGHKCGVIDSERVQSTTALVAAALSAVIDDRADVIILKCGAIIGGDQAIRAAFIREFEHLLSAAGRARGWSPIPVIDPLPLAISTMIAIIDSKLSTSKLAYPLHEAAAFAG